MQNLKQQIQNFIGNNKNNINSAIVLILIVDALFAILFATQFMQNGICRNYMITDSALKTCSFGQFAISGWKWLSFMDLFVFLPVIAWAMTIPSLIKAAEEAHNRE